LSACCLLGSGHGQRETADFTLQPIRSLLCGHWWGCKRVSQLTDRTRRRFACAFDHIGFELLNCRERQCTLVGLPLIRAWAVLGDPLQGDHVVRPNITEALAAGFDDRRCEPS
jgi:hypothetical protein